MYVRVRPRGFGFIAALTGSVLFGSVLTVAAASAAAAAPAAAAITAAASVEAAGTIGCPDPAPEPTIGENPPVSSCTTGNRAAVSGNQSPGPNPAKDMTYHNTGPVMTDPHVYTIFWLPTGDHYESDSLASSDTRYENLVNRFFQDVGANDYHHLVSQYTQQSPAGSPSNTTTNLLAGTWTDSQAYPGGKGSATNPLEDSDIQAEVTRAAGQNPGWVQDVNHIWMVYTAYGIDECHGTNKSGNPSCNFPAPPGKNNESFDFCAYHTAFNGTTNNYSFMGDASSEHYGTLNCSPGSSPNGDSAADAEVNVQSHEFAEAESDPTNGTWFNVDGNEIGDVCNTSGFLTPTNSIGADVYLNGNPYDIQQEWSNAVHGCALDINGALNSDQPPVLVFSKSADATAVTGQPINYKITVTNPSDTDAALLTTVTDALPAGVTYVAGSANPAPTGTSPLTWNVGTIAVHDKVTITFQATSNPQTINNCAQANYDDMLQIAAQPQLQSCFMTVVSKAATTTMVASDNNPSAFGQPVTLTATVAPKAPGVGMPTGTVHLFDGATPLGSGALVAGSFSVITSSLSVGTHSITATYDGDDLFLGSTSASLNQEVDKAPTTTTLTANPPGSVGFGHPVTFTASVAPAPPSTSPTALPTGPVVFSVDGTPVQTVTLDASQRASVTTSALAPGSHTIEAAYQGDGNYLGSIGDVTGYRVTCAVTITGTHNGAVQALGDSTCIVNATVHGAVVVHRGASVAVIGSSVSGAITASDRPGRVLICGTTVGGSVTAKRAGALVIVGDPGDAGCAVNRISGALVLQNNTNGVEAIGNTVGDLVVADNSGPGPYPGDGTTISGNIIAH